MSITWNDFKKEIKEEYNNTTFVVEQLDHELNVLLERRQAFMSKDINPLVVRMDNILSALNPSSFSGDYLYKDDWYKNLDLESWGMYKYVNTNTQEGLDDSTMLVESLGNNNEIKAGAELLIETDSGEKIPRTVKSVEWSDYYEKYIVSLLERETTWDRKWMPDALYSKCIDPGDEQACIAYNPCTDTFYKVPIWDDDLPETVESDIIPLKVIYGVGPYTWTIISGESDGWSLESDTTDDGYNTLYSENTCNIPVIINVTDFCGNTTDEYTVTNTSVEEFYLVAPSEINKGEDAVIIAYGGSSPLKWVIEEMPINPYCSDNKCEYLSGTSGSINILSTSVNSCGSVLIKVTDKCGNIERVTIKISGYYSYRDIYYWNTLSSELYSQHKEIGKVWAGGNDRPALLEVRSIINNHFTPDFLKSPLIWEISEKLWSESRVPRNGNLNPPLLFPEYGYLPGEENQPGENDYNNYDQFEKIWNPITIPWSDTGYSSYVDLNGFQIFIGSPSSAVFSFRSSRVGPISCFDLSNVSNYYYWENNLGLPTPKVEASAALMAKTQGRGANIYTNQVMSGTVYGIWPFYCSETFLPEYSDTDLYWYVDVGRWMGYFTLRVITCNTFYGGVYKINDDGTYSEQTYIIL